MRTPARSLLATLSLCLASGLATADTVTVFVFSNDFSQNHPSGPQTLPQDPTINVGDTVRWVHVSGFHNVKSVAGVTPAFQSPNMFVAGTTFERTFNTPGVVHYYCTFHGADLGNGAAGGMSGTITVVEPPPACPADLGAQGGQPGQDGALDNNDFIAFIDLFFAQNAAADLGAQGGTPGNDGQFDNNDFIVFIDLFFQGCSN